MKKAFGDIRVGVSHRGERVVEGKGKSARGMKGKMGPPAEKWRKDLRIAGVSFCDDRRFVGWIASIPPSHSDAHYA